MTSVIEGAPQSQAMLKEVVTSEMSIEEAIVRVMDYLSSGMDIPVQGTALPGSILLKVAPKGVAISNSSAFWMTPQQAKAIALMAPEKAGRVLSLPAAQAALMQMRGMEFYAISPKPGFKPVVFSSCRAPTRQGAIAMPGGAQQVIVPNRKFWSAPMLVNPFTLRPRSR